MAGRDSAEVIAHDSRRPRTPAGLTPSSILTAVLAVPIWLVVFQSAVLSRQWDGGVFLSVAAGIQRGLTPYSEIWDNKDPLFYGVMALVAFVNPVLSFVLDWLWIPLAALGASLIAARIATPDRALIVGLLVTPSVILLTSYVPGYTNTPATPVTLIAWGLVLWGRGIVAGVLLGVLGFLKIVILPVAVLGGLVLLLIPSLRLQSSRALLTWAVTSAAGLLVLAGLGWLGPWRDALASNVAYAAQLAEFRGEEGTPLARLGALASGWGALAWVLVAGVAIAIAWGGIRAHRDASWAWTAVVLLALTSALGTLVVLSLTYSWPHHAQALALPLILGGILLVSALPLRWPAPVVSIGVLGATFILGFQGSPLLVSSEWAAARQHFVDARVQTGEAPEEARLLNDVPLEEYRFLRLGTNDERGFIRELRPGVTLACAAFHQYAFSPASTFHALARCMETVDVVIVSSGYLEIARQRPEAARLLSQAKVTFDCSDSGSVSLCRRQPGETRSEASG